MHGGKETRAGCAWTCKSEVCSAIRKHVSCVSPQCLREEARATAQDTHCCWASGVCKDPCVHMGGVQTRSGRTHVQGRDPLRAAHCECRPNYHGGRGGSELPGQSMARGPGIPSELLGALGRLRRERWGTHKARDTGHI